MELKEKIKIKQYILYYLTPTYTSVGAKPAKMNKCLPYKKQDKLEKHCARSCIPTGHKNNICDILILNSTDKSRRQKVSFHRVLNYKALLIYQALSTYFLILSQQNVYKNRIILECIHLYTVHNSTNRLYAIFILFYTLRQGILTDTTAA